MSVQLNLFPTIDKTLYEKIGYMSNSYKFSYHKDGYDIDLDNEANESHGQTQNVIQLIDSNSQWHANAYDLCFKRKCMINNPGFLFGANGIAEEDAVLGVAIMWLSKSSSQRGIFEVCELTFDNKRKNIDITGNFPPGQLKGTLILETIVYLKNSGLKSSSIYADNTGTILGTLDTFTIVMDGNGSVFPIIEVKEPGQPLWYVVCSWTDPMVDSFDEDNIRLCINTANPSYNLLKLEEGLKESPFLKEILAGAMQTIVLNVMSSDYWDEILKGEGFEDGSIGQAINYFINTFGWETNSPERLAMSIRKDFDLRL